VSEQAKAFHALDRAATVICYYTEYQVDFLGTVKLSLCLIKHYAVNKYGGLAPPFLTSALDVV
jgi:hypothetical protein